MSLLHQFQAILFDMDGLMFNSETLFHSAWQQAVTNLGYEFDHTLYMELVGRSNDTAEALILEALGNEFPIETFRTNWFHCWQSLVETQGVPLKPGLLELLDFLESQHIPKAVGTSSSRNETCILLNQTGIGHRFDTVVTVDDAGRGKPAPDIFLLAAQKLGILPANCLVLEDSNAGVEAAITAGSQVIMVPDLQMPTSNAREWALSVCASLHEVLALIR